MEANRFFLNYYYCCYCCFAYEIKTSILSSLDIISSFTWCPFDYNTKLVCQLVPMPRGGKQRALDHFSPSQRRARREAVNPAS